MKELHTIKAGNTNCFVLIGDKGSVLLDTGTPGHEAQILSGLKDAGLECEDLKLILLTHGHFDHLGSAAALREMTGTPIAIHAADRELAISGIKHIPPAATIQGTMLRWAFIILSRWVSFDSFVPDIILEDGQSLSDYGIEADVIHTPGHSPGSITVAMNAQAAFVGDLLVNRGLVSEPLFAEDREALHQSIDKIKAIQPKMIYPAHGDPLELREMEYIFPGRFQIWWWVP